MTGKVQPFTTVFVFRRQRTERLERYRNGQGPDEMLYGLPHACSRGWRALYIEGDDRRPGPLDRLWQPCESFIMRHTGIGFTLPLALRHMRLLRQADSVISTVDACGLPLALLKRSGILRTPLVYISQGLTNRFEKSRPLPMLQHLFRKLYRWLLAAADRVIVLGAGAAVPLIRIFHVPRERVHAVLFGIDTSFWTPDDITGRGDYILSVGNDRARDYETLLRAVRGWPLRIVTTLPVDQRAVPNVTISTGHTDPELRELYRQALCVVVPLHDVSQPAGQSVALQAMACGKPLVLTRTSGLWDPEGMQDLHNCLLVAPGAADDISRAITWCMEHSDEAARIGREARRTVVQRYGSERFAQDLLRHVQEVGAGRA